MKFCTEPVSRILIFHKLCSQRSSKNFIKNNEIKINGKIIKESSFPVDTSKDLISVNGKELPNINHKYIMLNKPCGVVCSTVSDSHKTVFDLLSASFSKSQIKELKCVGRLDCDTSGLLLLSSNGSFVKALTDPENKIEKTYFVKLEQEVSNAEKINYSTKIEKGFLVNQEKKSPAFVTSPAMVNWLTDTTLEITVTEGKFHEVRRIFSTLGNLVIELKRIRIDDFVLDENLGEGDFKLL